MSKRRPAKAERHSSGAASPEAVPSRAERRRAQREGRAGPVVEASPGWRGALSARMKDGSFRFALAVFLAGPLALLLSQAIPHEYGFLELGGLFTLSVYDLVLAILGLSTATVLCETNAERYLVRALFAAVLLVTLLFFDPIFYAIRATPLGNVLYLVAPLAVALSGAVLWLSRRLRRVVLPLAAAIAAFSLSLFIGLDDLGVGIADFAWGAAFAALWLLIAPAMLLGVFARDGAEGWMMIPARIIGSWLLVIAVIVTVSLYVPMPVAAPPPPTTGLQSGPYQPDAPPPGEPGEP